MTTRLNVYCTQDPPNREITNNYGSNLITIPQRDLQIHMNHMTMINNKYFGETFLIKGSC